MRILGASFFLLVSCSGGAGSPSSDLTANVDGRTASFDYARASWGSFTESPCVVSGHSVSATNATEQLVLDFPAALGEHDCSMMLLPRDPSSTGHSTSTGGCRVTVVETTTRPGERLRGTFSATLTAREIQGRPVSSPARLDVTDGAFSAVLAAPSPCAK
jgi:hypothetical protein